MLFRFRLQIPKLKQSISKLLPGLFATELWLTQSKQMEPQFQMHVVEQMKTIIIIM